MDESLAQVNNLRSIRVSQDQTAPSDARMVVTWSVIMAGQGYG